MESFLLVVTLVVLFIRWLVLSGRMGELQRRIEELSRQSDQSLLTRRVYALEQAVQELRAARPAEVDAATPLPAVEPKPESEPARIEPVPAVPEPEAPRIWESLNLCAFCGQPLPAPPAICPCRSVEVTPPPLPELEREPVTHPSAELIPPPLPEPEREPVPSPAFSQAAQQPASPAFSQRVRESMHGEEWEAVVGGSWLNKLGVLVLVIGIALFLGYSFTRLGPGGVSAIALGVSAAMLGGAYVLERRARYKIFARGLLGGGWAALYFTVYAMQAVPAAKVIDNPVLGAVLLIAVATGMIVHSLRYQSQTVTGLAYFVAFATLSPAITPSTLTALSVIALAPLAGSLLYVAYRFSWSEMALLGLFATYGTCISRGDSGAPLWSVQLLFTAYWLLFEGFDLLRAARRSAYSPWESAILPFNALAFIGLSYMKWSTAAPQHLHLLAGAIGAAYLVSTILRALLRPPSSFAPETKTLQRALSGGYEGPISLTAALTVAAIFLKFHGAIALAGMFTEAEALFLAGLFFKETYPRQLAAALFAGGLGKILLVDLPAGGTAKIGNWNVKPWTPVAALAALLFYINRALRTVDTFYGYAGSAVIAWILGFETPQRYVGLSWLTLAAILFAFGWWRRLGDFRMQGYLGGALGLGGIAMHQADVEFGYAPPARHPWISLSIAAVLSYLAALCGLRSSADRLDEWERTGLRRVGSWAATSGLLALAWRAAPGDYLGIAWMLLALPILELGLRGLPEDLRVQAYVVAGLGALRVFLVNALAINNTDPLEKRLILAAAALLAYLFAARLHLARKSLASAKESNNVFNLSSAAGTYFALLALWALLPPVVVGPAWAIVALLLMETGFALDLPGLRLQAHVASGAAFGRLFFTNFTGLGQTGVVSHRVLTVVPVLASYYYQWSRQTSERHRLRDWELPLGRAYLYAPAVLAVVLMRFELGRVLAVTGWAAFAVGLLMFGRRWNNADLRWQSYVLAALAFWRSWTTNFYAPESFAGVSGRILTGAFVIACFYLAQLLIPRKSQEDAGHERHARTFYSLLAASLLAVLLFYEVSGRMLTVAWGLEGVALLIAGFPLNDRVQRLTGMSLFLVCILKLFVYDLRHLETLYRIFSFIVLGLMLVGVSWIYTRFRDRIQRYL